MTTLQWILLDLVVALLGVAAGFAAGTTAALGRTRLAFGLAAAALVMVVARVVTVAMLAGHGWWFVQEKVLLGLPLIAVAGLVAVVLAGRPLTEARREPDTKLPAGAVVALLTTAYAALAALVVTLLVGYPLTDRKSVV